MRTLIIADIHANYDALSVLPNADAVLCAGDIVTFGVEPNECIDWLFSRHAVCVRGEEDDAVGHGAQHALPYRLAQAGLASRAWTRSVLTPKNKAWLAALPPEIETVIEGHRIAVVHAYPGDYNRYLMPTDEELDRITRAFPRADIIVTSHTHRQGIWRHRGKVVINPGSVGQNAVPAVAAYAVYENGKVMFCSTRYNVELPIAKIRASTLPIAAQDDCVRELTRGSARPRNRLSIAQPVTA